MSELGTTVDYWALMLNYRLFVPKTFRSQERKVPMENFRSPGTKVPGNFRSPELSFPENESSMELSFPGPFVLRNFRSRELSSLDLSFHSHICVRWFITAVLGVVIVYGAEL